MDGGHENSEEIASLKQYSLNVLKELNVEDFVLMESADYLYDGRLHFTANLIIDLVA